ncbi:hypothetical protein EFK50_07120 [Nocardioides marmoriginsengisoli]|uniref:Uncharacterized protein n=1 Tax=Nocardioides marmoriginsengisoli TaxID=661483 RepID=A0A3N0CLX5_9ACTN|nr:hypothetical protein [Nocardioides marmoriginsengisoli]RNL64291.1 hypothetical protein EFK50_07120 [Nocardioides marmoriginsengisoli]
MDSTTVGYLVLALAAVGLIGGGINLYQAHTGREIIKTGKDATPEDLRRNSTTAGLILLLSAVAEIALGFYLLS